MVILLTISLCVWFAGMVYSCLTSCLSLNAPFIVQKGNIVHSFKLLASPGISFGTDTEEDMSPAYPNL